jgi:hypothetical protein
MELDRALALRESGTSIESFVSCLPVHQVGPLDAQDIDRYHQRVTVHQVGPLDAHRILVG